MRQVAPKSAAVLRADDVEVVVDGEIGAAVLLGAEDLALDHLDRRVREEPQDLEVPLGQRHGHRVHVEVVADQHRQVVAPAVVDRRPAAADVGLVDDVVVDQRGRVDELHHRARRPRRGSRRSAASARRGASRAGRRRFPPPPRMCSPTSWMVVIFERKLRRSSSSTSSSLGADEVEQALRVSRLPVEGARGHARRIVDAAKDHAQPR